MRLSPRALDCSCVVVCSAVLFGCVGLSHLQNDSKGLKPLHIVISPINPTLAKGTTLQLGAMAVFENGDKLPLTDSVEWTTSTPAVFKVDAQGEIVGVGIGVGTVSAMYEGLRGATSVTIGAPALLSITVSPNTSSLAVGESEQLNAVGTFSDGSMQNLSKMVAWSSSAATVGSVNSVGSITARAVGATTISATSASMVGSALLTVNPAAVITLSVVPETASVVLQGNIQFQAVAVLTDGTTQNISRSMTWSSSRPDIAPVTTSGKVIGQQVGFTTITAEGSGVKAHAGLTVTPLLAVTYFDRDRDVNAGYDGSVRLVNPGVTTGDLCAMVYVVDRNQALSECCGCLISDHGLRTLSVVSDLTGNPLTGKKSQSGAIMVISSNPGPNGQCDAASANPNGVILGWGSSGQVLPDKTVQITETTFDLSPLSNEATVLSGECSFLQQLGSGKGICSCGAGD